MICSEVGPVFFFVVRSIVSFPAAFVGLCLAMTSMSAILGDLVLSKHTWFPPTSCAKPGGTSQYHGHF